MSGAKNQARRLLVQGGTIVTPTARFPGDLLIEGERIAAIAAPGALEGADEMLDATGLLVLPGLVDPHVHLRDPGLTHKEDFGSGTRAAAAGGVTTVMVMPYDNPITDSAESLAERARYAEGRSFVDFALQGAVGPVNIERIPDLAAAGAVSLEVQLAEAPGAVGLPSPSQLRAILQAARSSKTIIGVYCEDESIFQSSRDRLLKAGRRDPAAHIESKPPIGEELAASLAGALAVETGAAVHLRQVSTRGALEAALRARARGADLTAEVTPHHLVLTAEDEARGGPEVKVSPPPRQPEDLAALRTALPRGEIDMVGTDHAPHAPAEKAAGRNDIWAAPGGFPGLETMLSLLLEVYGDVAPELIARVCAEVPARRFGLGRSKGRIQPGFDADLVLLDAAATWQVDPARLHTRAASSPFAGRELAGVVRYTLLRGRVVARDRVIVDEPEGRWLRPGGED